MSSFKLSEKKGHSFIIYLQIHSCFLEHNELIEFKTVKSITVLNNFVRKFVYLFNSYWIALFVE